MQKYADRMQDSVYEVVALGLIEPQLDEAQLESLKDAAPAPVMAVRAHHGTERDGVECEAAERAENLAGGGSSG